MNNQEKKKRKPRAKKQATKKELIPPSPRYESPKRQLNPKNVELKSTAIAKSPFSKMVEQLDPLPEPVFLTTPRQVFSQQMIYLRTPDNRQTLVEMKMAEKLDFDCLGESGRKPLDIIRGDHSQEEDEECDDYQYSYYQEDSVQEEKQEQQEKTPAQNIAHDKQPIFTFEEVEYLKPKLMKTIKNQTGKLCCNCKKSRCLKLYCECFRNNQLCQGCNCVQCLNIDQRCPERINAYVSLIQTNPTAFCPKIQSEKHTKGCNCKKSNCQKRYCECYQAGLACTELCRCQECKNTTNLEHKKQHKEKVMIKQGIK